MRIQPWVVNLWGVVPIPERSAAIIMANGTFSPTLAIPVFAITSSFEGTEPSYPAIRQEAWEEGWNLQKSTIVIDEEEIEVYLVNRQWMVDLADCLMDSECDIEAPYTYPLNFVTSPVPLEP